MLAKTRLVEKRTLFQSLVFFRIDCRALVELVGQALLDCQQRGPVVEVQLLAFFFSRCSFSFHQSSACSRLQYQQLSPLKCLQQTLQCLEPFYIHQSYSLQVTFLGVVVVALSSSLLVVVFLLSILIVVIVSLAFLLTASCQSSAIRSAQVSLLFQMLVRLQLYSSRYFFAMPQSIY